MRKCWLERKELQVIEKTNKRVRREKKTLQENNVARKREMQKIMYRIRMGLLFNYFIHELQETATILVGFYGRNAVDVRAVLDCLCSLCSLFLDTVMGENINQC